MASTIKLTSWECVNEKCRASNSSRLTSCHNCRSRKPKPAAVQETPKKEPVETEFHSPMNDLISLEPLRSTSRCDAPVPVQETETFGVDVSTPLNINFDVLNSQVSTELIRPVRREGGRGLTPP